MLVPAHFGICMNTYFSETEYAAGFIPESQFKMCFTVTRAFGNILTLLMSCHSGMCYLLLFTRENSADPLSRRGGESI